MLGRHFGLGHHQISANHFFCLFMAVKNLFLTIGVHLMFDGLEGGGGGVGCETHHFTSSRYRAEVTVANKFPLDLIPGEGGGVAKN